MRIIHWAMRSVTGVLCRRSSEIQEVLCNVCSDVFKSSVTVIMVLCCVSQSTLYLIFYNELPSGWNLPLWFAVPTIWTWQWPVCMHTCEDSLSTARSVRERDKRQWWWCSCLTVSASLLLLWCQVPSSQGLAVLCLSWRSGKEKDLLLPCSPKGEQRTTEG